MWALSEALSCRWNRSTRPLELEWYAVVQMHFEPNNCNSSFHRHESNWRPLTVEFVEGMPKHPVPPLTKAQATISAVISIITLAWDHRMNQSIQMSKYGHHIKLCIRSGKGRQRCDCIRSIFERWHLMHVLAYCRTSLSIPGQTYLVVIRLCVARMLGCKSKWRWWKILPCNWTGNTGLSNRCVTGQQVSRNRERNVPEVQRIWSRS